MHASFTSAPKLQESAANKRAARVELPRRGDQPSGKPQAPFIPLYSTEVPFYVYINAAKEKAEELIQLGLFENTMFNKWPQTPELQPTAMASAITALQKEKEDIEAERLMSTSKRGFLRSNTNSRRYSLGESS